MSVRRRAIRERMERNAKLAKGREDFDAGLREAVKAAVLTIPPSPVPHALDNEWRIFKNYYKLYYDVSDLLNRDILHKQVWPNAGKIAGFSEGECLVRISEFNPYTEGYQLDAETIARMEERYGKWQSPPVGEKHE